MMKYAAPLRRQLSHLHLPPLPARPGHPTALTPHASEGELTYGQRLAEQAAALVGSWRFLIFQSCILAVWVLVNALRLAGFDPPPFILLNLMLSFQAAFTGPVLLIAANVGAIHDHRQYDRIEQLVRQNEALTERLTNLETSILSRLDTLTPAIPATRTPSKKVTR